MIFKIIFFAFFSMVVYHAELHAQEREIYDYESLNVETENVQEFNNWIGNQESFTFDTIKKYTGIHSIKLSPIFEDKSNLVLSEAVYLIPAFYMKGDQVLLRITGDSLELKGMYAYRNAHNADLLFALQPEQENVFFNGLLQGVELKNINGNQDWTPFCIKIPLSDSIAVFSIKLRAEGNVDAWIDDLQLTVDGENISNKLDLCFIADKDKEFDNNSLISIADVSPRQLEDLQVLSKIWGFMKYYHPAITSGTLQWDYELFRILPKVLDSSTKEERNECIERWIKHLNRNIYMSNQSLPGIDTANCYVLPNYQWMSDCKSLGSELVEELNKVMRGERADWNYYIRLDRNISQIFSDPFIAEKHYPSISWKDPGYRLLTLFRFWNVIEYCYPYKNETDLNWDKVLEKYLPCFIHVNSQTDYLNAVYALCAEINDSHGWMLSLKPYMFAAIFCQTAKDVLVRKSYSCQLHAGDIILRMEGKDINDIIKERKRFIAASNEVRRRDLAVSELNRWDFPQVDVVCLRGNDTLSLLLTDFNLLNEIPGCTSVIDAHDYKQEMDINNIIYLPITTISAESISQIERPIMNSKGIILDCRGYPSDDSFYDKLSDLLFPYSIPYMEIALLDIKNPGVFRFYQRFKAGSKNPHAYKGKLVILVNSQTQSAAETAVMMFQQVPNSITLGSQSAGANGGVDSFMLPGGIETMFTGEGCYYPNRGVLQRKGVKIDIKMEPTKEMILKGRDEQLEKAIELIINE